MACSVFFEGRKNQERHPAHHLVAVAKHHAQGSCDHNSWPKATVKECVIRARQGRAIDSPASSLTMYGLNSPKFRECAGHPKA